MMHAFAAVSLAAFLHVGALPEGALGQSTASRQTFEIADVRVSPRRTNLNMRTVLRGGRYEVLNATMADLIRTAYGVSAEKVVGGPNWLEYDRFDVVAKAASNTPQDTLKLMLQALLADRFKLAVRNDTRPIAGFALTLGKDKPKLKPAEPSGQTGCQQQPPARVTPVPGQITLPTMNVTCRNVTMEAFASSLTTLAVGYVTTAVVDLTGLKGTFDFDVRWTLGFIIAAAAGAERVTVFEAIDKQLGLKLEEQKIPMSVVVVEQVNKTPTENPTDVEAKLPALPAAEFEVATIRPSAPITAATIAAAGPIGFLPGGRVNLPRFPLRLAISLAWNLNTSAQIPGAPNWVDTTMFDIVAKVPEGLAPATGTPAPLEELGPMLQALLKERFGMKAHFEDRAVTAHTLVAGKHKLKKADPASRTGCKTGNAAGAPVSAGGIQLPSRQVTCQNMTMAQFADQLQILAGPYIQYPVVDSTGLEGAWDFTFSFSPIPPSQVAGLRGANPFAPPGGADPAALDPVGGNTVFDAVEKDLGLKLEPQKRSYPVFVIDHIEEKPTEN